MFIAGGAVAEPKAVFESDGTVVETGFTIVPVENNRRVSRNSIGAGAFAARTRPFLLDLVAVDCFGWMLIPSPV